MACVDCRFFVREDDGAEMDKGICRRRPPTVIFDPETGWAFSVWPHVDWIDWCGECERRAAAREGIPDEMWEAR